MINSKWRGSLQDVRTYRGADIGSDHDLVIAKIRLKLAVTKKTKRPPKLNTEALLIAENAARYAIEISNRFDTLTYLEEGEDVEREWQEFKTAVRESTEAAVSFKKKSYKSWLSKQRKAW